MPTRILSGFVAVVVSVLVTSHAIAAFTDVRTSTNYREAILYAQTEGIVSGYPDGSFKPGQTINRAEFTKIIDRTTSTPDSSTGLYQLPFEDVDMAAWYVPYLASALSRGLISGYPDGTFRPTLEISFVEAAKIITLGFGYQIAADAVWYKPYVLKLEEQKAIPTSITSADQKITRGEMVEMIYRMREKITDQPSQSAAQLMGGSTQPPSPSSSSLGGVYVGSPTVGNCPVFPNDNPWNTDISEYPLHPRSDAYIASIGSSDLHPDFGGNGEYGIPYEVVDGYQPKVPLLSIEYEDESDPGPYPIPDDARIEGGSDHHVLVIDQESCTLYELFAAEKVSGGWNAGSAAIFNLLSNELRPDGWTSADAAGLPIFPGLVRYDEAEAGEIKHAIRFTAKKTQKGYIHPATHFASSITDANVPPMGLRVRLKANYDLSGLSGHALVIATAMKKYGMILADNGSNWYFTGAMDPRWDDENLNQLKSIPGSAFEAVYTGEIHE